MSTSAVTIGDKNFVGYLENSSFRLGNQVNVLAEVILLTKPKELRSPLHETGRQICMALGKICCFYANQSGVTKEHLAIIRNNAKEREERGHDSANGPYFLVALATTAFASPVSLNPPPLGLHYWLLYP